MVDSQWRSPLTIFTCWGPTKDVGFMGYNVLAGGMLTGKYLEVPPFLDHTRPFGE